MCRDAGAGAWSAGGSSTATTLKQALGSCNTCSNGLTTKPTGSGAGSALRYISTKPTQCGKLLLLLLLPYSNPTLLNISVGCVLVCVVLCCALPLAVDASPALSCGPQLMHCLRHSSTHQ